MLLYTLYIYIYMPIDLVLLGSLQCWQEPFGLMLRLRANRGGQSQLLASERITKMRFSRSCGIKSQSEVQKLVYHLLTVLLKVHLQIVPSLIDVGIAIRVWQWHLQAKAKVRRTLPARSFS